MVMISLQGSILTSILMSGTIKLSKKKNDFILESCAQQDYFQLGAFCFSVGCRSPPLTLFQSIGAISPTYKTDTFLEISDVLEAIKAVLALLEKLNYDI